jgi:GrpB-like predicted nucleotidyltransferase (UPF0157 family)
MGEDGQVGDSTGDAGLDDGTGLDRDPVASKHLDQALEEALIGGREERVVVVADPDPRWPEVFERHRAAIVGALGPRVRRIDHVGSTSVPGLAAKPIVDIQVTVDDPEDDASFSPALETLGYELRVREPRHRMFRTPAHDVQVHVWAAGSDDERRHVLFRDWLRVDEADRRLYEDTKRRLAGRRWRDVNYYADAKSPVIQEIMARAESWAVRVHWQLD